MKWVTHLISSLIFAVFLLKFIPISIGGFVLLFVASILPDLIDAQTGNHRGFITHNFLVPLAAFPLVFNPFLAGFVIGYGHHLLIDMTTKQGVYFGRKRVRGFLYSNDLGHNAIILIAHNFILLSTLLP